MGEKYNKLVRDNIPEQLKAKGIPFEERIADQEEYPAELIKKLAEEITEFQESKSVEELADILEVIDAIKKLPPYTNVEQVKTTKLAERGGFEGRKILKGEK